MKDLISRQALCEYALNQKDKSITPNDIMRFPSAQPELIEREAYIRGFEQGKTQGRLDALSTQPERLTDDDFETIRIHLNAYKEKLCNQHRWEEANEYQRIIDRFMAFASAQPEHTSNNDCNGCKFVGCYDTDFPCANCIRKNKDYYAPERRTDDSD